MKVIIILLVSAIFVTISAMGSGLSSTSGPETLFLLIFCFLSRSSAFLFMFYIISSEEHPYKREVNYSSSIVRMDLLAFSSLLLFES